MSDRIDVKSARTKLEAAGLIVSDFGDMLYVDADCTHCGSRYNLGHMVVDEDDTLSETSLQLIMDKK